MEKSQHLKIQINEKPDNKLLWFVLSIQHIFAMFGATVLVPKITGMDPSVAIFCSGVGTLLYIFSTRGKVPVYLGSSFAYIYAITATNATLGPGATATGLASVGIAYIIVSITLRYTGVNWLKKLLPPIIVGPMIIVIGLGLANIAVGHAGLSGENFNAKYSLVALLTMLVTALFAIKGKGFFKIVPILMGITFGYIFALLAGIVDTDLLLNIKDLEGNVIATRDVFSVPSFILPFKTSYFGTYSFDYRAIIIFLPITLVTIAEHIGDHTVLSSICEKDFISEPGLKKTLLGDGLATLFAGLVGGPANTTYGENTGVVAMTKVGSVYVIGTAAIFAIILSFLGIVTGFIESIPTAVMGGIEMILFGIIASNGVKILIQNKIDFNDSRNLIIASVMLILGIGGATISISPEVSISGMSMAVLVGILLNLFLPKASKEG